MLMYAYIRNDVLYTHDTSVCSCSQFGFLSAVAALNCICPRTNRWHWGGSSLQVEYENGILVLLIADTCFVHLCFYRALRYTLRSGSCQRVLSLDCLFFHTADQDTVSERLRRWTRNPLGSVRRGSNPLGVASLRNCQC